MCARAQTALRVIVVCVCFSLVLADDVHILASALLRRRSPAAHMLTALPLLLSLRRFFLQLLALVLRPAVLKPHLHLQKHTVQHGLVRVALMVQQLLTLLKSERQQDAKRQRDEAGAACDFSCLSSMAPPINAAASVSVSD